MEPFPGDLTYCRFPRTYGSTAGPFGGVGGCAMTTFTLEAWASSCGPAVVFCGGKIISVTPSFVIQSEWEGDRRR